MKILKAHNDRLWVTAVINNRWVQAKVYNEPSTFGINNGRISKLVVCKTDVRDPNENFFNQMDYNYDRGLDFDNLPDGLLSEIVSRLESLPKIDL